MSAARLFRKHSLALAHLVLAYAWHCLACAVQGSKNRLHLLFGCRGNQQSLSYNKGQRRNTLQVAILGQLQKPPPGFEEAIR